MRLLRLFGLAVLALLAAGMAASAASALLPTVLFLPGGTSILLTGNKTEKNAAHLGSAGVQLEAEGLKLDLTALSVGTSGTKLGPALILLLNVKNGAGESCQSEGLGVGDVHLPGEWHLVYTGLGGSLNVGLLILFFKGTPKITCGELGMTVEGSWLTSFNQGAAVGGDITQAGLQAECEGVNHDRPVHPKYENEAGMILEAKLTVTVGGLKENVCLAINGELIDKAAVNGQMMKIDL